jgi:hypothetical protein
VSQGGPPGASTIERRIEWAADAGRPTVQDLGVHRGGRDVQVPEQLLNCQDIAAVLEEMGGARDDAPTPASGDGPARLGRALRRREGTLARLTAPPSPGAEHGEYVLGQLPAA